MTKAVLAFLIALVFIMTGPIGILLMAVGTAIGLVAPLGGARRSSAMGCLLLPLAAFYMGL
jgi:TctA family transporter